MPFVETIWNQQTPIERAYPYLSRDAQCEVAVVGAGLAGALCAWHLCQSGREVMLLTRSAIGMGATSASAGILRFDHEDGVQNIMKRIGPHDALETYHAAQGAIAGLERIVGDRAPSCGFTRRPAITFAQDRQEASRLRGDFELLSRAGFNVGWLDQNAFASQFSFPAAGALQYHAGAAEVDPYRLATLLIRDACDLGMRVYEYSEAASVQPLPSGVLIRTSLGLSLRAKYAVIATGEPPTALKPYLSAWRTYSLSTLSLGTMQGWGGRALLRKSAEGLDLRTVGEGMLISGQHAPVLVHAAGLAPRRRRDALRYAWLEDALKGMFPAMAAGISPAYRFCALVHRAADGLPVIGQVDGCPGVFAVAGYGLDGGIAGMIAGRMLPSLLRGDRPPLARLFGEERLYDKRATQW